MGTGSAMGTEVWYREFLLRVREPWDHSRPRASASTARENRPQGVQEGAAGARCPGQAFGCDEARRRNHRRPGVRSMVWAPVLALQPGLECTLTA